MSAPARPTPAPAWLVSPLMPAPRSCVVPACLVLAVVTLAGACASESDSGSDRPGGPGGGSVSGYLAALPADGTDGPVMVTYGDLARAEEISGIERPDDISDTDAIVDYLMDLGGIRQEEGETARVATLVPGVAHTERSASDMEGFVDDVGWSVLEVDSFAERDTPPRRIALLDGDFDGDRLEDALDDGGDELLVAGDPGGDIDPTDVTPARPLGEGLWLSLDDARLTVAAAEADVTAAGEADGGDDTLADDPALESLATALDHEEVYSAVLVADAGLGSSSSAERVLGEHATPEQIAALDELPQCDGITGTAIGVADDGEPLLVLAISFTDSAAAENNLTEVTDALADGELPSSRRPWSEVLDVEEIRTRGSAVLARARPDQMMLGQWSNLVASRDFPPC